MVVAPRNNLRGSLRLVRRAVVIIQWVLAKFGSEAPDVVGYGCSEFNGEPGELLALSSHQLFGQGTNAVF
jgi:hypothetical protein